MLWRRERCTGCGQAEVSLVLCLPQDKRKEKRWGLQLAQSWSCCCTQGSSWLIPACQLGCPGQKAWLRPGFPSGKQWEASPRQVQSPAELAGLLLMPSCGLTGVYSMWSPLSACSLAGEPHQSLVPLPGCQEAAAREGGGITVTASLLQYSSEIGQK